MSAIVCTLFNVEAKCFVRVTEVLIVVWNAREGFAQFHVSLVKVSERMYRQFVLYDGEENWRASAADVTQKGEGKHTGGLISIHRPIKWDSTFEFDNWPSVVTLPENFTVDTVSILPSQLQKTIVRKLTVRCESKNYSSYFEHSILRTKSRLVNNHIACLKKIIKRSMRKNLFHSKVITMSIFYIFN